MTDVVKSKEAKKEPYAKEHHFRGVLSQEEIDRLLTAIVPTDGDPEDIGPYFSPVDSVFKNSAVKNIEDFELFLTERKFTPEKVYGSHSFKNDVTMCRFFETKNNETILADIERKNKDQNMGNIVIPNTNIKLINYSICPKCKTVFSYKDLIEYYRNPIPDSIFNNRGHQMREDTRIRCIECEEYFLPAMVIVDGTPKNEVQFLCRMQTVEGIERFFMEKGHEVLSKNPKNIFKGDAYITVQNDVLLQELEPKPTLISNLLQYTPIDLMPSLIDGTNIEKGDVLFGKFKPVYY